MVGVVTGNGLGLFSTSLDLLGTAQGNPTSLGQAKGSAYVNAATGNLSVQFLDESLSGSGADLFALRTYNSLGAITDGDTDGWRWNGEKKLVLSGTRNTAGSTVTRTLGDGSNTVFAWDATNSRYQSTDGSGAHDILTWNTGTSEWEVKEDGSTTTEFYDGTTGWIKRSRDNTATGVGFDYVFTGNKLTSITDLATRQRFDFIYGGDGKLAELKTLSVASSGDAGTLLKQVSYTYHPTGANGAGLLASVTTDLTPTNTADNSVYTTNYTYNSSHKLASISQNDGTSASFTYDGSGRILTVTDQTGITTFSYNTASRVTTVSNQLGNSWTYAYDTDTNKNRLLSATSTAVNGASQSATYTYDTNGNIATVKDGRSAAGNTITYTYDSNGNRTKEVDSLGNTISRTFGTANRVLAETRYSVASLTTPSGEETTRYAYDAANRLRFVISAEGRVSENRYNSLGLITSTLQYAGAAYPVSGLSSTTSRSEAQVMSWVTALTASQKEQTQVTELSYDYRGNLSKKTDYAKADTTGNGVLDNAADITEYVYSEHGQLLQTIAVRGASRTTKTTLSSVGYDGMGRQISVVNSNGTTTTTYSGLNITVTNTASGLTTTSTTDSSGRLTSLSQNGSASNRISNYYYDNAGQLRMTQDPTGARTYLFYDAAGRVNGKVDAAGAATVYTHDADSRVLTETRYATPIATATLTSWATTQPTALTVTLDAANDRKTTYTYDQSGRLKTTLVDGGLNQIINDYDGASRLIQTTQGARITKYYYDKDGRQIGTLDAEKSLVENQYDAVGRLIKTSRYGTAVSTVSDFATMKIAVASGLTLSSYYFYDAEGRLTGAVNEQGFLSTTVYDAALNRRSQVQYMTAVTVSASDKLSDLITCAGTANTTTTQYDTLGRVDTVTTQDGTISRNIYDGAGRLVRQIQAEGTTDQRATRTQYNAYGQVTGVVSGVGEATLIAAATNTQITTAITNYGTTIQYDGAGRKVTEIQPNGQKTFLFYNAAGQLTYTVNALGEVAKTLYNAFGQVKEVYVFSNRMTTANLAAITTGGLDSNIVSKLPGSSTSTDVRTYTTYNKLGMVATVDANSTFTTNAYNTYGQLETATQRISSTANTATRLNYDLMGRIKSTIRDDGGLAAINSIIYDGFGRVRYTTDANGKTTETKYTFNGRVVEILDPLLRSRKTEMDALGRTLNVYDGFGNLTSYSYNDTNRSFTVTSPEGVAITTTKTRTGETLTVKDGNNNITTYAYTKDGKLDTVTNALGVISTDNTYDNSGRLYESKDANGVITRYTYDAANRVTEKAVDPTGLNIRTSYQFDGAGRQILVTEGVGTPEASTTEYRYNYQNKISYIIVDPSGLKLATGFTYDDMGNTLTVSKGVFNTTTSTISTVDQNTQYTFDKLGRKTSEIVDPSGLNITTQYKYDANGNLTRVIDANINSAWFVYNDAGQKTRQISAEGGVTTYSYDNNGRLHYVRSYANTITTTSFGDVVTSITLPSSHVNDRRSYSIYDKDGRVTYSLNAVDSINWTAVENIYDAANNLIETRAYDKTITETQINDMTTAGTTQGGFIVPSEVGALISAWGYSATSMGNSRIEKFTFDKANRKISEVLDATVGGINSTTQYKYDAAGNITRIIIEANNSSSWFVYDKAGRKTRQIDALGGVVTFDYDSNGLLVHTRQYANTISTSELGDVVTSITLPTASVDDRRSYSVFDAANRVRYTLTAQTDTAWIVSENIYDARGNVTELRAYDKTFTETQINNITATGSTASTQITVTEVASQLSTLGYSGTVTGEARVTKYIYDKAGRQKITTLAGWYDVTDSRVYAAQESQSDRFQRTIEVTYDAVGNAVANKICVGLNDYIYQYKTYDKLGREIHDIDGLGFVTQKTYDALGNLTKQTRAAAPVQVRITGYWLATDSAFTDSSGNIITLAGRSISYEYDKLGRQTKVTQPTTGNTGYRSQEAASTNGVLSTYNYSAAAVTEFVYDALGNITKQTQLIDNAGTKAENYFYYDRLGRQVLVVDAMKYGTKTTYDALGNIKTKTEYAKPVTGVISTATQPDYTETLSTSEIAQFGKNRNTYFYYNTLGQLTSTTTISTSGASHNESKQYNAFGEVKNSTDALNNKTHMEYDRTGKIKKIIEPVRQIAGRGTDIFVNQISTATPITTMVYNAFGERTFEIREGSADLGITVFSAPIFVFHVFDHAGNEIQTTDAMGNISTTQYDVAGKVIGQKQVISVTGTSAETDYAYTIERRFEYDKAGRQVATYDIYDNGTKKTGQYNKYNGYGEVTEEKKFWGAASATTDSLRNAEVSSVIVNTYVYDDAGRVLRKQGSEGFVYYYYDLAGRVTRTEQRETQTNTNTQRVSENYYDLLGRITVQRLPSYTATTGFGPTHVPTIQAPVTSVLTPKLVNTYDRWGNVLTREDAAKQITTYTYNQYNQVLTEVGPETDTITYVKGAAPIKTTLEHQFVYDKLGRVVEDKYIAKQGTAILGARTNTKVYNAAGQLIETTDAMGVKQRYIYDIHGNRVGSKNALGHVTVSKFDKNNQQTGQYLLRNGTTEEYTGTVTGVLTEIRLAEYKYDQAGRKYGEADAEGNYEYYKFDERNNITLKTNRVGNRKFFEFDELNHKVVEGNAVTKTTSVFDHYDSDLGMPVYVNVTSTVSEVDKIWSYKDTSNKFIAYDSDKIQALSIAGLNFIYTYTKFGELEKESYVGAITTSTITYGYWENGLQKSISDVSFENSYKEGVQGNFTTTVSSHYYYDIKGNRTAEKNRKDLFETAHTEIVGYDMNIYDYIMANIPERTTTTDDLYNYYQYDNKNRLINFQAPNKDFKIDNIHYNTSGVSSFVYQYDEWGNRRHISVTYKLPQNATIYSRSEWYTYDAANRVEIEGGLNINGTISIFNENTYEHQGAHYVYDGAGRRATKTEWTSSTDPNKMYVNGSYDGIVVADGYNTLTKSLYSYNDLTLISNIQNVRINKTMGVPGFTKTTTESGPRNIETNTYDSRGFKKRTVLHSTDKTIDNTYDKAGRTLSQTTYKTSTNVKESVLKDYVYTATGDTESYLYGVYKAGYNAFEFTNAYTNVYQATYQGKQVSKITVSSSQDGTGKGTTYNRYDLRGRLVSSHITEARTDNASKTGTSILKFVYNAAGQIIVKAEDRADDKNFYKTQNYYYSPTGGELANLGIVNGVNISPLSSIAEGGDTPGSYTINNGDTLMGISQMLFGDSKFWYLIADANGITKGPTDAFSGADVGRNLRIPNTDKNISNTSNNWKPYNPSEVIGDLTPDPKILPPKKAGCNIFKVIIVCVVAAIAACVVGPAVTAFFNGGFGAVIAGGFAGGVAGSVASQAAGMAMGMNNGIDLKQAFSSGIAGALTAGVGSALSSGTNGVSNSFVNIAKNTGERALTSLGQGIVGAASVAASAVANKIMGMESNFSWASMAAGFAGGYAQGALGLSNLDTTPGTWSGGRFTENLFKGFASGAINATAQRVAGVGGKQDWGSIAANSFGNALGASISNRYDLQGKAAKFGKDMRDAFGNLQATVAAERLTAEIQKNLDRLGAKMLGELEAETMAKADAIAQQASADGTLALTAKSDAAIDTIKTNTGGSAGENAFDSMLAARLVNEQNYQTESAKIAAVQQPRLDRMIAGNAADQRDIAAIWEDYNESNRAYSDDAARIRSIKDEQLLAMESYTAQRQEERAAFEANPYGKMQSALDSLSMSQVPILSEVAGAGSGIISAIRGDWTGAGLAAVGIIPFVGTSADVARKAHNATNSGLSATRARLEANIAESAAARDSSGFNQLANKETAYNFYRDGGLDADRTLSHMSGIDFKQPVDIFPLPQGSEVVQYQIPGRPVGGYFAPLGTSAESIGVDPVGRLPLIYRSTENVSVLRSTAADTSNALHLPELARGAGGGTQYYTNHRSLFELLGGQ